MNSGFSALGFPVPLVRKQAGYELCKELGVEGSGPITELVGKVSSKLERDEPFIAIEEAQKQLDVTGSYRLVATLLTGDTNARIDRSGM